MNYVTEEPSLFVNVAASATTAVKTKPGILKSITVGETAAGTIIAYDSLAASGTVVATLKTSIVEGTYTFNVKCNTGITVISSANSKFTVTYQ